MTNTATQTTSNGPHATPASESTNSFARPARGGVSFVHPLAGQTHRGEALGAGDRRTDVLRLVGGFEPAGKSGHIQEGCPMNRSRHPRPGSVYRALAVLVSLALSARRPAQRAAKDVMGLLRPLRGRRAACLVASVGLVALVAAGCGGQADIPGGQIAAGKTTPETNGLERQSAAEVRQAAAVALKAARSVQMTMTGRQAGQPLRFEVRSQGESSMGTMEFEGLRFEGILIGHTSYLKGDRSSWMKTGAPRPLVQLLAGHWVTGAEDMVKLDGFTRDEMAAALTESNVSLKPRVEQTTLDGQKAVVISYGNGTKIYVANTGRPYPLRFELPLSFRVVFTDYEANFRIAKPADSVDMTDVMREGSVVA